MSAQDNIKRKRNASNSSTSEGKVPKQQQQSSCTTTSQFNSLFRFESKPQEFQVNNLEKLASASEVQLIRKSFQDKPNTSSCVNRITLARSEDLDNAIIQWSKSGTENHIKINYKFINKCHVALDFESTHGNLIQRAPFISFADSIAVFKQLCSAIAQLHNADIVHGMCYPEHIYFVDKTPKLLFPLPKYTGVQIVTMFSSIRVYAKGKSHFSHDICGLGDIFIALFGPYLNYAYQDISDDNLSIDTRIQYQLILKFWNDIRMLAIKCKTSPTSIPKTALIDLMDGKSYKHLSILACYEQAKLPNLSLSLSDLIISPFNQNVLITASEHFLKFSPGINFDWITGSYGRKLHFEKINDRLTLAHFFSKFISPFTGAAHWFCFGRNAFVPLNTSERKIYARRLGVVPDKTFDFNAKFTESLDYCAKSVSETIPSRGFNQFATWYHVHGYEIDEFCPQEYHHNHPVNLITGLIVEIMKMPEFHYSCIIYIWSLLNLIMFLENFSYQIPSAPSCLFLQYWLYMSAKKVNFQEMIKNRKTTDRGILKGFGFLPSDYVGIAGNTHDFITTVIDKFGDNFTMNELSTSDEFFDAFPEFDSLRKAISPIACLENTITTPFV
jgi:hypothetical protein